MQRFFGATSNEDESEWLSVSDLMAGLMVIFLFIAIVFIRPLTIQNERLAQLTQKLEEQREALLAQKTRIKEIAVAWQEMEQEIYASLLSEFENDLRRWNAEIQQETLLVRFKSPDVLFERGKATIRPEFATILSDFFPRYVAVLREYEESIEEIRIEGHTSSIWNEMTGPEEAYFRNMELSQSRTRAVLQYVLNVNAILPDRDWLQPLLTANGLSSSRLVRTAGGKEDMERSRRVEFRVRTKARTEIVRILDEVQ